MTTFKTAKEKKKAKEQIFENGAPCGHEDCLNDRRRLPCRGCGRQQRRGTTIKRQRITAVHYERMSRYIIQDYIILSPKDQEKEVMTLYIAPDEILEEFEFDVSTPKNYKPKINKK